MANNLSSVRVSGTSTEKNNFASTLKAADAGFEFVVVGGYSYSWNGSSFDLIGMPKSGGASIIPSNYAAGPVALSTAGDGYAIASGARYLSIGVTVALTGTGVFLAFGTSELDAEANVSGTVGSEVGMMIAGASAGQVVVVGIPTDPTITHFALAENHAAPTGKVSVTQGV